MKISRTRTVCVSIGRLFLNTRAAIVLLAMAGVIPWACKADVLVLVDSGGASPTVSFEQSGPNMTSAVFNGSDQVLYNFPDVNGDTATAQTATVFYDDPTHTDLLARLDFSFNGDNGTITLTVGNPLGAGSVSHTAITPGVNQNAFTVDWTGPTTYTDSIDFRYGTAVIPEPGSFALMTGGAVVLAVLKKCRRRRRHGFV
jgi:hypothetical protein